MASCTSEAGAASALGQPRCVAPENPERHANTRNLKVTHIGQVLNEQRDLLPRFRQPRPRRSRLRGDGPSCSSPPAPLGHPQLVFRHLRKLCQARMLGARVALDSRRDRRARQNSPSSPVCYPMIEGEFTGGWSSSWCTTKGTHLDRQLPEPEPPWLPTADLAAPWTGADQPT